MKRMIYIAGVLFGLSACQSDEPMATDDADRRIFLAARVEGAKAESRMAYWLTAPTLDNPLEVDVWASTTENVFKDSQLDGKEGNEVSLHTTARFTNGEAQLLNDAVYPKVSGESVYFVGMHPKGWQGTDAGTSASYTFDGNDDVMFAPQISGKYGGNTNTDGSGKWPTFTFRHLLTWLRIEMVAESEAVSDAWGKVQSLKVKSPDGVTVDLSQDDYTSAGCVSFSGDKELSFYRTGTDEVFEDYTLKGPFDDTDDKESFIEEVAYVLCAPVDATEEDDGKTTAEYTLLVETEKRTVEIPVDLMSGADKYFEGTTMNHQFTLLLNFKMGDNISVMAKQTDWQVGGIGSGDFNETDGQ